MTPVQRRQLAALDRIADADIDFSDIPEVTDFSGFVRGPYVRPTKRQLTVRLDKYVVDWFKSANAEGGYQTAINDVLRSHVDAKMRTRKTTGKPKLKSPSRARPKKGP